MDSRLAAWFDAEERLPILLRGARQTGKTTLVRELGRRADLLLELDLERHGDLGLVRACAAADELVLALQTRHNIDRFPPRTLLLLDEVQEHAAVVPWLGQIGQDFPDLRVVATSSLLELDLGRRGAPFPVGGVSFGTLQPLGFLEFLAAVGKDVLRDRLVEATLALRPAPLALHGQALALLRDYLFVGGMPAAVRCWADARGPAALEAVHRDLLQGMAEELRRFRGVRRPATLLAAFDNLGRHYTTRFKYRNFAPGYGSALMKTALARLEAAMFVTRVWPTRSLHRPIERQPKFAPGLLPLDVGLALRGLGLGLESGRDQPLDRWLEGRAARMLAGQLLRAALPDRRLHCWVGEANQQAEVDYLIPLAHGLGPVEVRPGAAGALKSLHQFLARAGARLGLRMHAEPLSDQARVVKMPGAGALKYRLLSLPLYAVELLPEIDLQQGGQP